MENYQSNLFTKLVFVAVLLFLAGPAMAACTFEELEADELSVGIMLEWSTTEEDQNELFYIERSLDNKHYTTIGEVKGSGYSKKLLKYNFLDSNARPGNNWYRLRQVNSDGSVGYSQVIKVHKEEANNFIIRRQPKPYTSTDFFEVDVEVLQGNKIEYLLTDWKGKPIQRGIMATRKGVNTLQLNLTGLRTAIYTIELRMGLEVEHLTIRKINDNYQLLNLGKVTPK